MLSANTIEAIVKHLAFESLMFPTLRMQSLGSTHNGSEVWLLVAIFKIPWGTHQVLLITLPNQIKRD